MQNKPAPPPAVSGKALPPHPATVQNKPAPPPAVSGKALPPHPATTVQNKPAPPPAVSGKALPPHPATTVQNKPALGGMVERPPHPATRAWRREAPGGMSPVAPRAVLQRMERREDRDSSESLDFDAAHGLVMQAKEKEYDGDFLLQICQRIGVGAHKRVIQLKDYPKIGLAVALSPEENEGIRTQLNALRCLRGLGLSVVPFDERIIEGLPSKKEDGRRNCLGYLLGWIEGASQISVKLTSPLIPPDLISHRAYSDKEALQLIFNSLELLHDRVFKNGHLIADVQYLLTADPPQFLLFDIPDIQLDSKAPVLKSKTSKLVGLLTNLKKRIEGLGAK
ncbi:MULTISPECIES: hypothetical protein [Sorangium]|uniref:hypothetical protein n=1 Tax=Sorangium TaxID=39643 RepID=UPI00101A2375|nr:MULTISPECIES: hypothetical protein [Sorangium]